jgi:hypothetical protein
MNKEKFIGIYSESRNGANTMTRHPLVRSFVMSDGVIDAADTGCWWLMDIFATELPAVMRAASEHMLVCIAKVVKGKARLSATGSGDVERWKRCGIHTDMPDGIWNFYLANEGAQFVLILPTEY